MKSKYQTRILTATLIATTSLLSSQTSAGLIAGTAFAEDHARGFLDYDPQPENDLISDQISYSYLESERVEVDLSSQNLEHRVSGAVDNFADAPSSERLRMGGHAATSISLVNSGATHVFTSQIDVDFGIVEAPVNADFANENLEGMFEINSRTRSNYSYSFSIDTQHEYSLAAFSPGFIPTLQSGDSVRFRSDDGILFEGNSAFSGEDTVLSGILDPGTYHLSGGFGEEFSPEGQSRGEGPGSFGDPQIIRYTLALTDLDSDGSGGGGNGNGNVPAPASILLMLSGIGLLRLKRNRSKS